MTVLNALKQLRDDIKVWVTNNLNALNAKIDEKTIPIDSELSETSTNPVISEDNPDKMVVIDETGNIIFQADSSGVHATSLSLNGEPAATEAYVDEAVANIEIPEIELADYYNKEQTDLAIDNVKDELSESIMSESDEWQVVDNLGNIIFSIDSEGLHSTDLELKGKSIQDTIGEIVSDKAPKMLRVKMAENSAIDYSSEEIIKHIQNGGNTTLEYAGIGELAFMYILDGAVYYGAVASSEECATVRVVKVTEKQGVISISDLPKTADITLLQGRIDSIDSSVSQKSQVQIIAWEAED